MSEDFDRLVDASSLGGPEVMQYHQDDRIIDGQTGRQFLTDLFETELCAECAGDAVDHIASLDQFGKWHAWCTFMAPRGMRFNTSWPGGQNRRVRLERVDTEEEVAAREVEPRQDSYARQVLHYSSANEVRGADLREEAQQLLREYRLEQHNKK
ncbi:hypothetical protein [Streptomyces atratus]|uniref:hypothetical protein n=1 Tax=Streptomyces atratus TaxID=1893 RepID=UPI00364B04E0